VTKAAPKPTNGWGEPWARPVLVALLASSATSRAQSVCTPLDETTFGEMANGTRVNLEVDILAKYVASLLGRPGVDAADA